MHKEKVVASPRVMTRTPTLAVRIAFSMFVVGNIGPIERSLPNKNAKLIDLIILE